jgi:hypothetical protein
MFENYPILNYSGTSTFANPDVLYATLGTFWTSFFAERGTIRGYSIGQSEELVQHYLNLVELINSYSSEDIPVFHREKWFPVRIRKSKFKHEKIYFESETLDTVLTFGEQKYTTAYAGVVYAFGSSRDPSSSKYAVAKESELRDLKNFRLLTNKIIAPTRIYNTGADVQIRDTRLIFGADLFSDDENIKYDVFDAAAGDWVYYTDESGVKQVEQEIILWAYQADIDQQLLWQNFGYLFDVKADSTQLFKDLLNALVKFYSNGPTIQAVQVLAAALLGVPAVKSREEQVQDIFRLTDNSTVVITDVNVYKYDAYYNVLPSVVIGTKVYAGDVLVDAVQYFDYVRSKRWWTYQLFPRLAYDSLGNLVDGYADNFEITLPPYLFLGNYQYGLTFKNDFELATKTWNGTDYTINFPVYGSVADVQIFHDYINDVSEAGKNLEGVTRQEQVAQALGMYNDAGDYTNKAVGIYPLDFVFDNFFKSNSALVKLNFKSQAEASAGLGLFSLLREVLPSYVYFMFYADFALPNETVDNLDGQTEVWAYTESWVAYETDSVVLSTNTFNITDHGFVDGDTVVLVGNDLPKGILANRVYEVSYVNANSFKLRHRESQLEVNLSTTGYAASIDSASSFIVKVTNYGAGNVLLNNPDGSTATGNWPSDLDTSHAMRGYPLRLLTIGKGLDLTTVDSDNKFVVPSPGITTMVINDNTRDWVQCNEDSGTTSQVSAGPSTATLHFGKHCSRILFFDYTV